MREIDPKMVADRYNSMETIWNRTDRWHLWTESRIGNFISNVFSKNKEFHNFKILNAGSGGNSYGINENNILHIDIAGSKISHLKNSLISDLHQIPLTDKEFDMILCVGSVINYCDPIVVISEFNRLIKPNGYLLLEFENSRTFELLGKPGFNKKAALVKTFFNNESELIWFFSESYIKQIVNLNGYKIVRLKRFHIISPLIYRVFKFENVAARFAWLDSLFSFLPFIRKFSSNTILLLRKSK